LHNAIFAGAGAVVLCLCPSTQVQGTIAALNQQVLVFQCPEAVTVEAGVRTSLVDVARFKDALKFCMDLAA
ncbi:MAG TPA: hypothetical protein VF511_08340, partial [Chthoniobacterales bacterium]|jgi:hypothetical protein